MQVSDEMVKVAARAAAKANGDDYDQIPADKSEWTQERGQFGGRYRDVNEPYKTDYEEMAEAALTAALALSGWRTIDSAPKDGTCLRLSSDGWPTIGSWNKHRNAWCINGGDYPPYGADEQPTHWKPLDAPPATAGKES